MVAKFKSNVELDILERLNGEKLPKAKVKSKADSDALPVAAPNLESREESKSEPRCEVSIRVSEKLRPDDPTEMMFQFPS